jgi:hypothetical protein
MSAATASFISLTGWPIFKILSVLRPSALAWSSSWRSRLRISLSLSFPSITTFDDDRLGSPLRYAVMTPSYTLWAWSASSNALALIGLASAATSCAIVARCS